MCVCVCVCVCVRAGVRADWQCAPSNVGFLRQMLIVCSLNIVFLIEVLYRELCFRRVLFFLNADSVFHRVDVVFRRELTTSAAVLPRR